jgi:two-component system sensor histidine kinase/response regulator
MVNMIFMIILLNEPLNVHANQYVRPTKRKKTTCVDDCFRLGVLSHLPFSPATGKGGLLDPHRFMASSPFFQLARPPNAMTEHTTLGLGKEEYFAAQQQRIYRRTDSLFACLLILQWLTAVAISIWVTPQAWIGTASQIHPHARAAVLLGGIVCSFPLLMIWKRPGQPLTRHSVAIAQMLTSALFIHLTGGRIETHFLVFGSLAFLAFYRDWRVLLTGSVVVAADHLLRGVFWPDSLFGVHEPDLSRALEHLGWVVFIDIFLCLSIRESLREMRHVAGHQAELETLNVLVESKVSLRTAELAASEEGFRQLCAAAPIGIYQTDSAGRCLYVNHRWTEISGLSAEKSLGDGWIEAIYPDDRKSFREDWATAVRSGVDFEREYRVLLPTQEIRWVCARAKALRVTPNEYTGQVVTTEDITERKRAETELAQARDVALESASLRADFLAHMSHEIRTPMNAVLGMTELLLDTDLTSKQREFGRTVRESAERLLVILNDILDFSKIEAGKLSLEEEDFDLREIIEDTLELLAESAHSKGLELAGLLQPNTPTHLRGDSWRIRQVLTNLLGNAIKFTKSGEVVVYVSEERRDAHHLTMRFEVLDTGIGIAAEAQAPLFQAFAQAEGSSSRQYSGTGLGLAICQRLVELMKGEIGLRSELSHGSLFWFTAQLRHPVASIRLKQRPADCLRAIKVLVVDDNRTNGRILHYQLSGLNMHDDYASSAEEALQMLRAAAVAGTPYPLAILDMQMPTMSGLALARIMQSEPALSSTRKIILTSLGLRLQNHIMQDAGISECLFKPVKEARLLGCLTRIMREASIRPAGGTGPGNIGTPPSLVRVHGPLRILLAEDNPIHQKLVLLQLGKLGYRADLAVSGSEVLKASEQNPYDVILMDCHMPGMGGYEATGIIRERESMLNGHATLHTHIVAMTADAMEGDREKCLAAGMDDYLSKPTRIDDLSVALGRSRKTAVEGPI